MATQFPRVNPGDVITATQWNQVLAALEDIYSQIGAVSTKGVAITAFNPAGPVKAGDPLTILGRNFEYSIGAQIVFFGGAQINTFLLGSSDTQLIINVPDLPNIPDQGQPVTIVVYNRTTSDSKQITVVPPPVTVKDVSVSSVPFTGTPTAGQTSNFSFVVTSNFSVTRSVAVSAIVTPPSLQPSARLLDANGNPLGQLSLQAGASVTVIVSIAIPQAQTGNFTVAVKATDVATGSTLGSSPTNSYTVNQQSQTDPNIQFGSVKLVGFSSGQGNALSSDNTITLPASGNSFVTLTIQTTFLQATKYKFTTSLTNTTGWQVTMLDPPPPNQELDFSGGLPSGPTTVKFRVDAQSPAANGQAKIIGQTSGQTKTALYPFTLATR